MFTLVSSIQDEVHRFAIGYHRQQRKKATISTTLTSIPGIGETRAKALMKHFTTIRAVSEATEEMLEETPGMNALLPAPSTVISTVKKTMGNNVVPAYFSTFLCKNCAKTVDIFLFK